MAPKKRRTTPESPSSGLPARLSPVQPGKLAFPGFQEGSKAEDAARGLFGDLEGLIAEFLEILVLAPLSQRGYAGAIRSWGRYLSEKGVIAPSPDDVAGYRNWLEAAGNSPNTINFKMSVLKRLFRLLAKRHLYPDIVGAAEVKRAKTSGEYLHLPLNTEQLAAFVASFKPDEHLDWAFCLLLLSTGIRQIEARRANVGDIHRQGDAWILRRQSKGHRAKDRFSVLPDELHTAIQAYLLTRPGMSLGTVKPTDALFVNEWGLRLSRDNAYKIIRTHLDRAGIKDPLITPHSLRHTWASVAIEAGASVLEVQDALGHSKVEMTMRYAQNRHRMDNAPENKVMEHIPKRGQS